MVLLLWIIFVIYVGLSHCRVCSLKPYGHLLGKESRRANILAVLYAMFSCVFVTFPGGVKSRGGTWLYRFLIFAFILRFLIRAGIHKMLVTIQIGKKPSDLVRHYFGPVARKPVFRGLRATQAQTSLRTFVICFLEVSYLGLLQILR